MRQSSIPHAQLVQDAQDAAAVADLVKPLNTEQAHAFAAFEDWQDIICSICHLEAVSVQVHNSVREINLLQSIPQALEMDFIRKIIFLLGAAPSQYQGYLLACYLRIDRKYIVDAGVTLTSLCIDSRRLLPLYLRAVS